MNFQTLGCLPVFGLVIATITAAAEPFPNSAAMAWTPPQQFESQGWRSEPVLQNADGQSSTFSSGIIAAALDGTKQDAAGVWRIEADVAVEPWQGVTDNADTGEVTAEGRGVLFAQASSSAPSGLICSGAVGVGGCWKEFANRKGCYRWIIRSRAEESFTWSGECPDGIASGTGVMEHHYAHHMTGAPVTATGEGSFVDGLEEGQWVIRWSIDSAWGISQGASEGPFEAGRRQGHWVLHRADGSVQEGTLVDGWKHGHWVYSEDGRIVEEGSYVHGARDGHWTLYGPDGTVEEGPMLPSHSKDGVWTVRKADGSVYTETYSEGELISTGPAIEDTAAMDSAGDVADTTSIEQQEPDDSVAAADTFSAEKQTAQTSEVLPSPEICVEIEEVTSEGHGHFQDETQVYVVIANGCPEPVLILSLSRQFHEDPSMGVGQHWITPSMSWQSSWQGLTFEERLVETMDEEMCEQYDECYADVLQPGQHTFRAWRAARVSVGEILPRFEWAACAQYHPLSLDAASGPRECDVNPAFFMPNTQEARDLLFCPEDRTLESCFRGQ